MSDSADAEELDLSPMSPSQEMVRSGTKQLNISGNGKAVNAAADSIRIHKQSVDIAKEAKAVNMNTRSNRVANSGVANNHINIYLPSGGSPYDSLAKLYPRDESARFSYKLKDTGLISQASSYQPNWDETHEKFSDPRDLIRQQANM